MSGGDKIVAGLEGAIEFAQNARAGRSDQNARILTMMEKADELLAAARAAYPNAGDAALLIVCNSAVDAVLNEEDG